jgi:hypothetical protein
MRLFLCLLRKNDDELLDICIKDFFEANQLKQLRKFREGYAVLTAFAVMAAC